MKRLRGLIARADGSTVAGVVGFGERADKRSGQIREVVGDEAHPVVVAQLCRELAVRHPDEQSIEEWLSSAESIASRNDKR